MFHKVTHTTAMIGIVALLGTSLSYGAEKPSEVINHHTKNNISSTYEPDALTLTTQNGQILYRYHENKKEDPASLTK